jgi:protein-tyrosine-phosphatase
MESPSAILFSCTHNAVRSPMAEGLMKYFHGRTVYVQSAGAHAGELDPFAVAVMEELGIDISRHKPRAFHDLESEDTNFDLIVSLSPEAHHHAIEMTRTMACDVEFWNMFDPTMTEGSREVRMDAYRQVRDELKRRILERFPLAPAAVMSN